MPPRASSALPPRPSPPDEDAVTFEVRPIDNWLAFSSEGIVGAVTEAGSVMCNSRFLIVQLPGRRVVIIIESQRNPLIAETHAEWRAVRVTESASEIYGELFDATTRDITDYEEVYHNCVRAINSLAEVQLDQGTSAPADVVEIMNNMTHTPFTILHHFVTDFILPINA